MNKLKNGMRATKASASDRAIAIYHVMRSGEGFEETARHLHALVRAAITRCPGKPRHLYLDIEGHRNTAGGYDPDAYEIQREFMSGTLAPYLTEIRTPLYHAQNPSVQSDDLAEELRIVPSPV